MFYNGLFGIDSTYWAFFISFLFSLVGVKYFIVLMKQHKKFQPIREEVEAHKGKSNTPTMGGLPMVLSVVVNILLWCNLENPFIPVFFLVSIAFAAMGLIDDMIKVFASNTKGFRGSYKLVLQLLVGGAAFFWLQWLTPYNEFNSVLIPIFNFVLPLGILYVPLATLALIGSGNAVNITDGLDGLLTSTAAVVFAAILIFIRLEPNAILAPLVPMEYMLDLTKICWICLGSMAGFLVFNWHPAKIFMGDVGSLFLGAVLFMLAVYLKIEFFYAIMGLLFIIEAGSSVLQVGYYKMTQKRIFKMAPIHHHFEKCGYREMQIVPAMIIFTTLCCALALGLRFIG